MQEGNAMHYTSMFADRWGFFLGYGENLTRIDNPGKWEDILFSFSRDLPTGSVVEEMSYTLQFRGSGAERLRKRITGIRTASPMVLEVRKWMPFENRWEVYYRGVIDDGSIRQHADYVEASTKPVGVSQDLIDKADTEYTVQVTGKRVEVPRVWAFAPLSAIQSGSSGSTPMKDIPAGEHGLISVSVTINPNLSGSTPGLGIVLNGSNLSQPYFSPSVFEDRLICAQPGLYKIINNAQIRLELWGKYKGVDQPIVLYDAPDYYNNVPSNQTYVKAGDTWIVKGSSANVLLAKGDTIQLCARTTSNGNLSVSGTVYKIDTAATDVRMVQEMVGGSITIEPIQDIEAVPPLSAPAVRDIDLFAQLCRQVTRRADLAFDFDRYRPAYFINPDGSEAAVFLLCLSRLRESLVEDGVATMQGTDEAYFKGITLNMFYKYFLAQGYKVGVENRLERGKVQPVVFVAPYCNTQRSSYFFPRYDPASTPVIADLGARVTDIELSRYERSFLRVVAGSDPEDFGAYPREDGYQDPCNRRISYGIGMEDAGDPYEITVPFPLTTLGLEEELQKFESESDEARQQRWTEGEGIHLVCGSADADGRIAGITQYPALPGLFYKPLNLGFRPESLVRRNIPILCMSLGAFDMADTFYGVEELEGDDLNVTPSGFATGDAFQQDFETASPITETRQDPDDEQGPGVQGIVRPVMITLRSGTNQNVYGRIADNAVRYGVVKFRYKGREVVGYLRAAEINPTELAVQKWELLPVWTQDVDFLSR